MDKYKIGDRNDESFLKPIPRWITVYGFVILIVLSILIVVIGFSFKVPRIIRLNVHITRDSIYTKSDFAQYEQIKNSAFIDIEVPLKNNKVIRGRLIFNKILIEGDNILIPITVNEKIPFSNPIKGEILCFGKVSFDDSPLISWYLKKPKIE